MSVELPDGRWARLTYNYVAVLIFFTVANNFRWEVIDGDPANDRSTTALEIEETYGIELPYPSFWTRRSLIVVLLVGLLIALALMI